MVKVGLPPFVRLRVEPATKTVLTPNGTNARFQRSKTKSAACECAPMTGSATQSTARATVTIGLLRPLRSPQRRSSNSARSPQGELASIMNVR
jgi:hypothetical protein